MSYRSASSRAAAFDQALREAMGSSVTERFNVEGSPASDPAAGTPCPEGVAVDGVASVTAIGDTGFQPDDGDGVEHLVTLLPTDYIDLLGGRRYQVSADLGPLTIDVARPWTLQEIADEHFRQARLRRWQETRG